MIDFYAFSDELTKIAGSGWMIPAGGLAGAGAGGLLGAGAGYLSAGENLSDAERRKRIRTGAAVGALGGASFGLYGGRRAGKAVEALKGRAQEIANKASNATEAATSAANEARGLIQHVKDKDIVNKAEKAVNKATGLIEEAEKGHVVGKTQAAIEKAQELLNEARERDIIGKGIQGAEDLSRASREFGEKVTEPTSKLVETAGAPGRVIESGKEKVKGILGGLASKITGR